MSHVDGNAIAGLLADALGTDATVMHVACAHCDTVTVIAEAMVTFDGPGAVLHCPTCKAVLMKAVETAGEVELDVRGIRSLMMPRTDQPG